VAIAVYVPSAEIGNGFVVTVDVPLFHTITFPTSEDALALTVVVIHVNKLVVGEDTIPIEGNEVEVV
jgi:hypothetical protein